MKRTPWLQGLIVAEQMNRRKNEGIFENACEADMLLVDNNEDKLVEDFSSGMIDYDLNRLERLTNGNS